MVLETGWLTTTPTDDNLFRQFLANQAELNEVIAAASGGRVARHADVSLADAGGVVPYFNQAVVLRPLSGPDDPAVAAAEEFFVSCPTATLLSIWPTPDLSHRGWTLVGHPAFVARPAAPFEPRRPPDVSVTLASNADELATVERIAIDGYPLDEARGLPTGGVLAPGLLTTKVRYRFGSVDTAPVAAASSYAAHGVTNLCLAATLPAARRRGVWESLVSARINDAPELPAVAFTSDYSRPGFERMGFLVITRFTLWWRGQR